MGLVTKVLPDAEVLATAERIAQVLAQKSLAALKASKQLLRRQVRPVSNRPPRTKWWSLAKEFVRPTLERRLPLSSRNGLRASTPTKLHSQGSSPLNELGRPQRNSLVSSNGANRSRRLALKRTKCRVDVSYSTFITGTCNCFAGARLLLSRCCVELGRSALQTWPIRVKGARND